MRRILCFLIAAVILLSLSACQSTESKSAGMTAVDEDTAVTQEESSETGTTKTSDDEVREEMTDGDKTYTEQGEDDTLNYDFSAFTNVEITGIDMEALSEDELSVLYQMARYCQAMTDADTDTMSEIVAEDITFTHMSGMKQTRDEYFADVKRGRLNYFNIGIENPVIEVNGDFATITYTSVLDANAYGAKGVYRMKGTHPFERRDGVWITVNR